MDDFGDFLQAPSPSKIPTKPAGHSGIKQPTDLNAKILSSFDLSGSSQRAEFKFQQPTRHIGKRPQGANFKQSSSSADWKNISLENEFVKPAAPTNLLQGYQATGSMLQTGQFESGQNDLMGLSFENNPSQNNQAANGHRIGNYIGHVGQAQPGISDWQFGANHSRNMLTVGQPPSRVGLNLTYPNQDFNHVAMHQSNTVADQVPVVPNAPDNLNFLRQYPLQPGMVGLAPLTSLTSQSVYGMASGQEKLVTNSKSANVEHRPRSHGNLLPSWMTIPNQIPPVYKQVLKLCATNNSFADTGLLYPIFLSSELPKDILGHIWTVANQSTPGKLTFTEVYTALALIALAQKGEMDLSVRYVLKLSAAPIPKIQLPQNSTIGYARSTTSAMKFNHADSSNVVSSTNKLLDFGSTTHVPTYDAGGFADFQSYEATESIPNQAPIETEGNEFQAYESFSSPQLKTGNAVRAPLYPDRDFINSPQHSVKTDTPTVCPPKQLLGEIDFGKFDEKTSTKVLPSFVKELNVAKPGATSIVDDDFDDFKSAEPPLGIKGKPLAVPPSISISKLNSKPPMQSTAITEVVDKYSSLRVVDSSDKDIFGQTMDNYGQADGNDKYSVFREVQSSSSITHSADDDFADFQSMPSNPVLQPSLVPSSNPSTLSIFDESKKVSSSEDILSISSLELPSLSRTILQNSIGSSSPAKPDIFQLPIEKGDNIGLVPSFPNVTGTTASENMNADSRDANIFQTNPHASGPDDGLYDLDEPVSPLSQRKPPVANPVKPDIPKIDHSVVRKKISNLSDNDFADFSSDPPPIDDDIDHHDLEYGLEEGDSSLVDFDAFGHFEEAKLEVQKKKEAAFKRTREDATAFSEFVKSSVFDLKPVPSDESCDTASQQPTLRIEQHSSVPENGSYPAGNVDDHESIDENFNAQENRDDAANWKLEPTCSEVRMSSDLKISTSEWEEEGNQLKARMEGSSNPMEIFIDHWSRCLSTCKDIIVSTGDIFASLNSPSVCHEVVNSNRGKEFISCTSEVYGVSRRIRKGMETVGLEDEGITMALKEIEIAWNNLLGFCPYTPSVHKTPEHRIHERRKTSSPTCSLCLLDTESTEVSGLEYCGRYYHAPCANLWLNQIAPILPRLEIPAT